MDWLTWPADLSKLLDVDVQQIARMGVLVALGRGAGLEVGSDRETPWSLFSRGSSYHYQACGMASTKVA